MPDTLLNWLLTPWSGATDHVIAPAVAWHGRLMVLAWAIASPVAILIARFGKIMPGQHWPRVLDNPFWWHVHRWLNYGVGVLVAIGIGLVAWPGVGIFPDILAGGSAGSSPGGSSGGAGSLHAWHAGLGWFVAALALLQIVGAHLRGSKGGPTAPRLDPAGQVIDLHGDHYDMTPRRILFERLHKSFGYLALLLAAATVVLGLWLVDAPRWMGLAIAAWWAVLAATAAVLQARGCCIDTYQAIWGPDPSLPGAAVRPVGWGIRRRAAAPASPLQQAPDRPGS